MTPPKFNTLGQYVWVTRKGQRHKERMIQPDKMVEMEFFTTSETESINLSRVEEETLTAQHAEIGQSSGT